MSRESQPWPTPASVRDWRWEDVVAAERSLPGTTSWQEHARTVHDIDTAGARLLRAKRATLQRTVTPAAGAAAVRMGSDGRFHELFATVDPDSDSEKPGEVRRVLAEEVDGLVDEHFIGACVPPNHLLELAGIPTSRNDPGYESWLLGNAA